MSASASGRGPSGNEQPDRASSGVGGRSGRGFGNRNQRNHGAPRAIKFTGSCEALNGHVYDCSGYTQADQYTKTTEKIMTYVGSKYDLGGVLATAIEAMEQPTIDVPPAPANYGTPQVNPTEKFLWEQKAKNALSQGEKMDNHIQQLYALVYGQCSEAMLARVEAHPEFGDVSGRRNGIELLQIIRGICFNFQDQKYVPQSIYEGKLRLHNLRQGRNETTASYYERYQNQVNVVIQSGGSIGLEDGLVNMICRERQVIRANVTAQEMEGILAETKERTLAVGFILGADQYRYGSIVTSLENAHTAGRDEWPKSLARAYQYITNWKADRMPSNRTSNEGVAFANDGQQSRGRGRRTCYRCGSDAHLIADCPMPEDQTRNRTGNTNATNATATNGSGDSTIGTETEQESFLITTVIGESTSEIPTATQSVTMAVGRSKIPSSWILLDNQSTVDVFANPHLLSNIHKVQERLTIHTQTGSSSTQMKGTFKGYGTVWFCQQGIANILSLSNVMKKHRVTFDSSRGNAFEVHKESGNRVFRQSPRGLYYLDLKGDQSDGVALINTVAENKSRYTSIDVQRAHLARSIQKRIGRPSLKTFLEIVDKKKLTNCPINRDDVIAAEDIFGPDIGSLKGKTIRHSPEAVRTRIEAVPIQILERYRNMTITGDIMKVNRIPFFVTYNSPVRFGTTEALTNQKANTIMACIRVINKLYQARGFRISIMKMDGEFEPLRGELSFIGITLNTVSRDEHVPEIERRIRTLKERARASFNTLPFKRMPAQMVIQMVYHANFWLNVFPPSEGISGIISPRELMTGSSIDFNKHCKMEFGEYAQVHEEHDNSMSTRTVGALAMRPTGNSQGGHLFYSLNTGRILNRNNWTPLPMPKEVIDRVHDLAKKANNGIIVTDRHNNEIIDEEDEFNPEEEPEDDIELDDEITEVDADEIADLEDDIDVAFNPPVAEPGMIQNDNQQGLDADDDDTEASDPDQIDNNDDNDSLDDANEARVERQLQQLEINNAPPEVIPQRTRAQAREANALMTDNELGPSPIVVETVEETVFQSPQMNMKQGLKVFGEKGKDAVYQEMKQLHDRGVMSPIHPSTLSREQRRKVLRYLMFLKQKRSGKIKGRGCADGRKQRLYTNKEDASSPTVAIESLLLSSVIDATEGRHVITCDIPGAFMQADMDELVHMKLEGEMAELLEKIDPSLYRKYIVIEKGKPVLYVELLKALYGTLKAALLFWKRLSSQLIKWGFVLNPYDRCVANKTINGKQCTIVWHVDDLKISHVDESVAERMLGLLEHEFGKESPLSVTRGRVHDYLGMRLDFTEVGVARIDMTKYVEEILSEAPDDMSGEAPTPAASYLFKVNTSDPAALSEEDAVIFHHIVAKALFLCKRGRPDIQTAIAFLTTRVKSPDVDDYKKLKRMIQYLRATAGLVLRLEADNLHVVQWWVDGAYGVHGDYRSHTGATMTLGRGSIYSSSTKQKLNTRSSTEAELVAVDDVMHQILWTRYFLEAQGYTVSDNIVYQDNMSAMLLENNGMASSGKRTKHINMRYYFAHDRIVNKEMRVEHCPTLEMIADFFTKPLQGSLFRKLRDYIMNCVNDSKPVATN